MRIRIIVIILILFTAFGGFAAIRLEYKEVDELTSRYYKEQKWDSVIRVGKKALREKIDYYYLRVRLGVSFYQKRQYFQAATHLEKARIFNSGEPYVADYLYLSYLNSNQQEKARVLKARMATETNSMPEPGIGFLEQVHAEGGYTVSSDRSPGNLPGLSGKDSLYGEEDLYGNDLYANIGLKLRISKRVSLNLAYSYLNFRKTKYIQYGRVEDQLTGIADSSWGENYIYSFPWVMHDTAINYRISQNEIHLGASISLPAGFRLMPAFHFIHVAYPSTSVSYSVKTVYDTAFYTNFDSTFHTFPFPRTIYAFERKDTSFNNYLVGLTITKNIGIFNLGLAGSWSNLNGLQQYQAGMSLTYYPLGNINFYGTTTATGFFQETENRLLLSQALGGKITRWMWLEGNFYWGDYTNANIFNGSVVYNNSDIIKYRVGASLVFPVGKHLELSLIWQYFWKESLQLYYTTEMDEATQRIEAMPHTKTNPYHTNTIIGGITWKL